MICKPCREKNHAGCDNVTRQTATTTNLTQLSNNWCDCQHVTTGTNINPVLVPNRPQER